MYSLYEVENSYHSRYIGTYFTIEECCAIINNELDIKIISDEVNTAKSVLENHGTYLVHRKYCCVEYTYKIVKGE